MSLVYTANHSLVLYDMADSSRPRLNLPPCGHRCASIALIALLLIPAAIVAFKNFDLPSAGQYHDDAVNLVTAKALADGKGYRIESLPDERWQTKYPPAFPFLLSLVWKLFPEFPGNSAGFLILAWAALPVLLFFEIRIFDRWRFPRFAGILACLCLLAHEATVLLSITLLPDLWFSCEVILVLMLAERASEPKSHWNVAVAAGLGAALAYLTKSSAAPLLASVFGVLLLRGSWRRALLFAAASAPAVLVWSLWSYSHLHPVMDYNDVFYSSYLREFAFKSDLQGIFSPFWSHARQFLPQLGGTLIPGFLPGSAFSWLRAATGLIGVLGIFRLCLSGRARHYSVFAALYALEICLWPSPLFSRYLLPVLPLWIAGAMSWLAFPNRSDKTASPKIPVWVPTAVLILAPVYVVWCISIIRLGNSWRVERQSLTTGYTWLGRRTPAGSNILAFRDPIAYLYSARHSEGLHCATEATCIPRMLAIAEIARKHRLRYVVIGPKDPAFNVETTRARLIQALESDKLSQLVFSSTGTDIYDVAAAFPGKP
jgi:hypothetical protein